MAPSFMTKVKNFPACDNDKLDESHRSYQVYKMHQILRNYKMNKHTKQTCDSNKMLLYAKKKTDIITDNLSNEERVVLTELRSNTKILIQRPDKGAGVIGLDRGEYFKKLNDPTSDPWRFATHDFSTLRYTMLIKIDQKSNIFRKLCALYACKGC